MTFLVTGLLLLGLPMVIFREPFLFAIGSYLVIQDPLQPVDVIHIIAGQDHRTNYAIQLYKQGYSKYIIFTGGWCETHGYHGERGRQMAVEAGILNDRIGTDDTTVVSTYQEVEALKRWMDASEQPIHSVMVVSDPFHMRRARWTYRQVLGDDVTLVMAPVPFEQTPYQQRWWTHDRSKSMVGNEYIKSIYYLARYQYSWGPIKEWLASLDTK